MSFSDSTKLSENEIAQEIIDLILTEVFKHVTDKSLKVKAVAFHYEVFKQALADIFQVYNMPKPCNDHSHIIEVFERDRPAKPSTPDKLIKNFL